ncbi:MAG: phosphoglycerate kinase [Burkholderiales bacterium PBB3]|nr:MAG: phosphoglycerate kinase [Burkholderiales bacterium PBB3]
MGAARRLGMSLWVVRHAQPQIAPGICYGALDVPADPAATQATAQALAQVLPQGAQLRCSVLQRCELLPHYLCALRPDFVCKPEPRLVEMNFGIYEGVAWADIPKDALDAWTADFSNHRFGGRESVAQFMARVAEVWDECCVPAAPQEALGARAAERCAQVKEEPAKRAGDTEHNALPPSLLPDQVRLPLPDQVWITHAGVARAAVLLEQGIRIPHSAAQWPAQAPAFGGWIKLGN